MPIFGRFPRRLHSLLLDSIEGGEIVLASGDLRTVSNETNTDLFWVS
jgi:hypothetical protein